MADEGGSNAMVVLVVVLVIALIAVFYFWQRDRESKDLEVEVGAAGEAVTLVAEARTAPDAMLSGDRRGVES